MMKYSLFLILFLFISFGVFAQNKYEREHRILKKQFPKNALAFVEAKLEGAKRVRFYRELDSAKTSFEVKFKKDRLHYSVEFDENGNLEDVEITISEIDLPNESWANIKAYLNKNFKKTKVRKIQQQYTTSGHQTSEETLRNAFQNLLIPSLNYEIIVAGKKRKNFELFEVLFDASGNFIKIRKSLPANYDHVLY
ncbi:hypothetical protein [Spongiimicrobium sp. 3-5]|uniref:hypothetical protein n=1 Tax=Spongiimicrobium sp. 3-5 TaxID=3332596 RepID=UPI00397FDDCF